MSDTLYEPIISNDDFQSELNGGSEIVDETEELDHYGSDPSVSVEYDEEFENLVNSLMRDRDYISVNQAALNITYTIINAGLIAIPFTAYNAGIPLFIAVVTIMAVISYYVAIMVIDMANQKKVRTLEDLAEVCGGPSFFLCVCAFQVLFSFSMMCVTLDVWADVMSDVFKRNSIGGGEIINALLTTRRGQVLVGAAIVLPLCIFKRSMISLRWTAYWTVCAVAFSMCSVMVAYFSHKEGPSVDTSAMDLITPQAQWWTVMFVVVFCFSYNQRVFAVYRCLKRRNTERWAKAVGKASVSVTVLYILFGIAGYLTMARKGINLDNFNYFLDDRGEDSILYNVSRIIVVSSLLLTIPVDSLIASSTWRRLYSRYLKLTEEKHHHPSGTTTSNPSNNSRAGSGAALDVHDQAEQEGLDATKKDPQQSFSCGRPYPSEDTLTLRTSLMSNNLSSCTTEYGLHQQHLASASPITADKRVRSSENLSVVDTLLNEQKKAMACSPPAVTLSHLNALMNDSEAPAMLRRTLSSSTGTSSSTGNAAALDTTDRQSFTSTSTGTGGASSTTGSGVAGHRMISKEEMQNILRANSFDSKGSRGKKNKHVEENPFDNEMEAGLNNSWLSNASLSYDSGRELRGLRSVSQAPGMHKHQQGAARLQGRLIPLTMWALCTASCIGVDHWMYIAASVGTLSTTMLLFIFPTMFYFRMTLASDYSATPLFARVVPNALYMGLIQAAGIAILLCDIVAIIYLPMSGRHIIEHET